MRSNDGVILWLIFLVPLAIAFVVGIAYWITVTRRDARRPQQRGFDVAGQDQKRGG